MTIRDCERALQLQKKIELYEALLKHNAKRVAVSTELIPTGNITSDEVSIIIPWESVKEVVMDMLREFRGEFYALGITTEDEP
jgi:hypothetical protein